MYHFRFCFIIINIQLAYTHVFFSAINALNLRPHCGHIANNILKSISLNEIAVFFFSFFTDICSNRQYVSNDSDDSLVPNSRQVIDLANDDGCIFALPLLDNLTSGLIFCDTNTIDVGKILTVPLYILLVV